MAKEFVPPSLATSVAGAGGPGATALAPVPAPLSPAAYRYYHAKATAARGALAGAVFPLASSSRPPRGSPALVDPPQISRPPMANLLASPPTMATAAAVVALFTAPSPDSEPPAAH